MPSLDVLTALDDSQRAAVQALAVRIEAGSGAPPLNDHTLAQLGDARPGLEHLLLHDGAALVGYAQVEDDEGAAELAVDAVHAAALLEAVAARVTGQLRIWAHGRRSPLIDAAERAGLRRVRDLWQLRRPLADIRAGAVPEGVEIRPFVPGRDEDAWLAVNAAAFADHAEQGRWTRRDIAAREAESWFDPAGFLLAWRGDELLGYHWTKIHPAQPGQAAIGEVYVLGVAPAAQGMRLGRALLDAGLAWLAGRGLTQVMLYVDQSNATAMALYERSGFARFDLDVQFLLAR